MIKINNYLLLFILSVVTIIFSLISNDLLESKRIFASSLIENYTTEQINEIIKFQDKLEWFSYLIIPVFLSIKISVIAAILDVGCFFFGKDIKYKQLFNIVVKAEFVFLLVIVFKTAWFYCFQTSYTLEDLQYFYPFSALNIIGYKGLEPWFIYPLQVLNLFELVYWLLLGYGLSKSLKTSMDTAMGIVVSSYGVGLLIWVGAVMFLTLNMS